MAKKRYDPQSMRECVQAILVNCGLSEHRASISANVLIDTDMRGIYSHGINTVDLVMLPSIRGGGTIPRARITDATRDRQYLIRHLNANGAPGHASSMKAVGLVKRLARTSGLARVFVYNANHFGAAAIWSEMISQEKDLEGRVYCTTSAHLILPGGSDAALGTNPLSWSIPYTDGTVTIDMATTLHAASGVCKAIREGEELPFQVYDGSGNLTTNPRTFGDVADFLLHGSLPALGACLGKPKGERDDVSYKGIGLGILIALVCSTSGGGLIAVKATVHGEARRVVHLFEAARIDTLYPQEEALDAVSEAISHFRQRGPDMLLPGEMEARQRRISLKDGIEYSDKQIERLRRAGREVGVGVDGVLRRS